MFKEDLKSWKAVEREFASRLLQWDVNKIEFSQGKFPDWDIKATMTKLWVPIERTYEVKHDMVSDTSGNVWFEYSYDGHPSGIYTSKADYIVYKLGDKFYCVDRLKLIIELTKLSTRDVVWWDDNKSNLFLIDREVFKSLAIEV